MTNIETVAASTDYVEQGDGDGLNNPNRKSKLFFGLCDMRTATVALNLLNIVFTVAVALILCTMYAFDSGPYKLQAISSVVLSAIVVTGVSSLGLYSAMSWKTNGMIAATVAFGAILVWRIAKLDFIDVLVTALLLYPHAILTMEMKSGIMTPETFDDEEYVTEGGRDFVEMANNYISPKNSMEN